MIALSPSCRRYPVIRSAPVMYSPGMKHADRFLPQRTQRKNINSVISVASIPTGDRYRLGTDLNLYRPCPLSSLTSFPDRFALFCEGAGAFLQVLAGVKYRLGTKVPTGDRFKSVPCSSLTSFPDRFALFCEGAGAFLQVLAVIKCVNGWNTLVVQ